MQPLGFGFRVQGSGFRVSGFWFRAWGSGFRGFRVYFRTKFDGASRSELAILPKALGL